MPRRKSGDRCRVGLALAGGGGQGAIYEIGALRAIDEALVGADLNDLDIYVGVSAGAFVGACLANGLSTLDLCRAVLDHKGEHPLFTPSNFVTPAYREWIHSGLRAPRLLWEALRDMVLRPGDQTTLGAMTRLTRALPAGLFQNEPIQEFLEEVFSENGRTDDFRKLNRKLVIVAADLDSGEPVRFGEGVWDIVPISQAVGASTALPGLYPPVEIAGRHYVDGVLFKTLHASVALDDGVDVLLCVNPIVPVDTAKAVERGVMRRGKLWDRGLPTLLSQTFRTLIYSRMKAGFAKYGDRYPHSTIVLLEPRRDDYRMFFSNVFSFRQRKRVCSHAYEQTRAELLANYDLIQKRLKRHGLSLDLEVLEDDRDLWTSIADILPPDRAKVAGNLNVALDELDSLLG